MCVCVHSLCRQGCAFGPWGGPLRESSVSLHVISWHILHLAFRRFRPSERAWECRPPTVDSQEGFLVQPPRATEPTGNTDDLGTFQVAPVGQARLPPMTLHAADEGRGPHLSPGRGVCPRPLSWCAHSCQHHCSMVPSPGVTSRHPGLRDGTCPCQF